LHTWEFIHEPSGVREYWRWRKKDAHKLIQESSRFTLFMKCVEDARIHGFDFSVDQFQLVAE
jgi:hypothetical protein